MSQKLSLKVKPAIFIAALFSLFCSVVKADADCRMQANKYAVNQISKSAQKEKKDISKIQAGVTSNFIPADSAPRAIGKDKEEYEVEVVLDEKATIACYAVQVNRSTCRKIKVKSISCDGD
jgi:hypothetical protein